MRSILIIISLLFISLSGYGQKERKFIREGNTLFDTQDFEKAEVEYRKALDKEDDSFEANFNLGDALYKQKKYDEALRHFSRLAEKETDKKRLGEIYHNIGNTLLALQKPKESMEAYKESLRNRPDSEDTKYNLEYARKMLQQQEENQDQNQQDKNQQNQDKQNQQQQNQDQDNKQDQNQQDQDQKDQQQDQQNQDQQNQDQQQNRENQKDQQEQEQEQQQGKISKEDAERLLEALQNDEKSVQERVQKEKMQEQKGKRMQIEKNW